MKIAGRDLIGYQILTSDNHKTLGTCDALVVDSDAQLVNGIVMRDDPLFSSQIIKTEDIDDIASETIFITSEDCVKRASELYSDFEHSKNDTGKFLESTTLFNKTDKEIGTVIDFIINTEDGVIEDYIVTVNGQMHTVQKDQIKRESSKKFVLTDSQNIQDGQMKQQYQTSQKDNGKKSIEKLKSKGNGRIRDDDQTILDKTFDNITHGISELIDSGNGNSDDKELTGKFVTKNILSEDDQIIAKRGDMITHDLVHKVRKQNMTDQLKHFSSNKPVNK